MSNQQQHTPSPLANRLNANDKSKEVVEAQKKLDELMNKDYNNNNNNNNNNEEGEEEEGEEEEEEGRTATRQKDRSAGKAGWSVEELADGAQASAKFFFEHSTKRMKKAEQDMGVFENFNKATIQRTKLATTRTPNGLAQKMNVTYAHFKGANANVLTDHCGKETQKTFESFTGALATRSGKTMEVDGEHALVQAFAKATQTSIPPDRDVAIAQMKTNRLYIFWKTHGIANPNVDERFTKISGNIPPPTQHDATNATNGGGRRKSKKVRKTEMSNEDARNFRQTAAANEECLKDRAMKLKENELAITYLKELPDGEAKTELQAKLTANITAMLSVPIEAPAAPALKDPIVVISDDEDENGDAPA